MIIAIFFYFKLKKKKKLVTSDSNLEAVYRTVQK